MARALRITFPGAFYHVEESWGQGLIRPPEVSHPANLAGTGDRQTRADHSGSLKSGARFSKLAVTAST
jgi:hypothetical protein